MLMKCFGLGFGWGLVMQETGLNTADVIESFIKIFFFFYKQIIKKKKKKKR